MANNIKHKGIFQKKQPVIIHHIDGKTIAAPSTKIRAVERPIAKNRFMLQSRKAIKDFINLTPVKIETDNRIKRKEFIIARLLSKIIG